MPTQYGLTRTEQRLMDVLRDGQVHAPAKLLALLDDGMASMSALSVRLFWMRRKLEAHGLGIVTIRGGERPGYKLVRMTAYAE